jgi:hypothetical protein
MHSSSILLSVDPMLAQNLNQVICCGAVVYMKRVKTTVAVVLLGYFITTYSGISN